MEGVRAFVRVSVTKGVRGVPLVGGVPLPRVLSLLSFMLMASDAPSGICEGREEGGERREGTGSGVSRGATEQHH